jgi:LacI family transcriptional regulator
MTIYDIAKEAGVSASTVSRVINDRPGVRPATKQKIEQLLEKYNYSPNETARGLVTQSNRLLGILVADIRNAHYTEGAYALERAFAKLGYCCIIFNTDDEPNDKAECIQMLGQRRVDGVVLIGSTFQTAEVEDAICQYLPQTPIVICNGYLDLPNVYGVLTDERAGVSSLVQLLFEKGHTNLAFVGCYSTPSSQSKIDGFVEGMRQHGTAQPLVYETDATLEGGYCATKRLMSEHPEVDGIVYSVDLLASGGGRALRDMGYIVPDQVAYVGIDNSVYTEVSTPRITSLDNKLLELSHTATHLLIDVFAGRVVSKKIMIFSSILERETT